MSYLDVRSQKGLFDWKAQLVSVSSLDTLEQIHVNDIQEPQTTKSPPKRKNKYVF